MHRYALLVEDDPRTLLRRIAIVCCLFASLVGAIPAAQGHSARAAGPAFVQMAAARVTSGTAVSVSLTGVTAGDTLIVYIVRDSAPTLILADSRGDSYASAQGPLVWNTTRAAQILYAVAAGGATTVTATVSQALTHSLLLYVQEYSGIGAMDAATGQAGSGGALSSGTLTTTQAGGLLFGGVVSDNVVLGPGAGYTARSTMSSNLTEDSSSGAAGHYGATAAQNGNHWAMQLVAFKPGSPPATATPTNSPTVTSTVPVTNTPTQTPVPATNTATNTPVPASGTATKTPVPASSTATTTPGAGTGSATPGTVPGCQFQKADVPLNVAFCETFNAPAGTGNRSGDLNGTYWGVSRISQGVNPGQGLFNQWFPTARDTCGVTQTVQPESDIAICNSHMVEAITDGDQVAELAMYPTQPFDIAGRTGTVTFDVDADAQGTHAAWPAFVYTDQPVPAPSSMHPSIETVARNSFGFSLSATAPCGVGTTGVDTESPSFFVTNNYVVHVPTFVPVNNCLTYQPGVLNHFEVRINTTHGEIWGSDAGSAVLKELGYADNLGLTFTRGLIWMEDLHYFANKFNTQGTHTFNWDNVGFDGPTLPRDAHLDVNDRLQPRSDGTLSLGWLAPDPSGGAPLTLQVPGATSTELSQATGAALTLNYFAQSAVTLQYRLNGKAWHSVPWPFPDSDFYVWRTLAMPVPLSELQAGTNTLDLTGSGGVTVANIDLILIGAQGIQ